jgi:plasmid maintenance system killer protein
MRIARILIATAIASMVLPVSAQQTGVSSTAAQVTSPGKATMSSDTKIQAKVLSIDAASRTLTLRGPKGNVFDAVAGDDVKNFAQIKVGDHVVVRLIQALAVAVKKTGSKTPSIEESVETLAAESGQQPMGAVGRRVVVLAKVTAVNQKAKTISLQGPKGNIVNLKVNNPEHFKVVKVGHMVEAVYTEAIAVSVEAAPATK